MTELVTPLQGLHHAFTGGDALKEHQVDSVKRVRRLRQSRWRHEDGVEDVEHSYFSFMKFF